MLIPDVETVPCSDRRAVVGVPASAAAPAAGRRAYHPKAQEMVM